MIARQPSQTINKPGVIPVGMPQLILTCAVNTLLLALSLSGCAGRVERENVDRCDLIAEKGHLNVLTLNLSLSGLGGQDETPAMLAGFAADNEVDVILLQGVVEGGPGPVENDAQHLRRLLATEHGVDYFLNSSLAPGDRGESTVGNAILSPCPMRFALAKRFSHGDAEPLGGRKVKLGRDLLMARLEIPGVGTTKVYNVHLCRKCGHNRRSEQINELLSYIEDLESNTPASNLILFGGSLNIGLFANGGVERRLYNRIVARGFTDAHAVFHQRENGEEMLCADANESDEHCTYGIADSNDAEAIRADYIFAKGFREILESQVVFNGVIENPLNLSDRAAVFSRLALP